MNLVLEHPIWLLGWLLIPLLWLLPRLSGGRAAISWSSLDLLEGGRSWRVLLAGLPRLLGALGLAALVLALARPQRTHQETVVESEGIDIVLALDVSGSMESPDFELQGRSATRLDVARVVIAQFVEGRPHDRIGLVVFGEEAFTQVPLTLDHDAVIRFLDAVDIGMAGAQRTAIGQGMAVASRRLANLQAPSKVVILLTDGRNNAGSLSPIEAAQAATALGIRIYTIGVGSKEGTQRGGLFGMMRGQGGDEVDEATLEAVATATGARYFRATDTRSLEAIYATIDELEKTTAEVKQYIHREELFRMALFPGAGLLLLELLLGVTLFRRLP